MIFASIPNHARAERVLRSIYLPYAISFFLFLGCMGGGAGTDQRPDLLFSPIRIKSSSGISAGQVN